MTDETTTRRPPTPLHRRDREPGTQWLGPHREQQLRNHLVQLPELVALVAANPQPLRRGNTGPRPTPGSRPPLSLHAAALTNRRRRDPDPDIIGTTHLDRDAGRRDGIEPEIRSWVILAEGEMYDDDQQPQPIPERQNVAADCAWLARHIVWVLEQQWVIELAQTVRRAVRDCEQHLHIRAEYRPTCRRQGCGGRLRDEGGGLWRCDNCDRTAGDRRRLSLRETVARQEPMTVPELHSAFGVTAAKVSEWVHAKRLQPASEGGQRYHVTEVLALVSDIDVSHMQGHGQAKTLADLATILNIPAKTLHDWHSKGLIEPLTAAAVRRERLFSVGDVASVARRMGRVP